MKTIIVEDEIASQEYLHHFLSDHFPAITIAAVADNVPEAVAAITAHAPDLVFLDVDIKMGTGFDVLAALPAIKPEIIFTTAFNQFAIDAFQYHAVDYLLKPLDDKRTLKAVQHCISRVQEKNSNQHLTQLLQHLHQPAQQKQRISIYTVEGIEFIDPDEILLAEAKGNYTELKLRSGNKITTSKKLKEIEQQLPTPLFFRVHHSYIIHTHYVKKYFKGRGGYVILSDETTVPVSAARKDDFLKHFGLE